ncbi:hypothetical protein EVAR_61086_1 [Eumeta japonica]|uniref:Uncharacterized protein n=1 Tax=Eumeta variegata TaxID=151549 RepID=A0A4C1YQB7_EUMVA|nr:hypothetical protein EVAR_61086_1 [Eumeta japonica]
MSPQCSGYISNNPRNPWARHFTGEPAYCCAAAKLAAVRLTQKIYKFETHKRLGYGYKSVIIKDAAQKRFPN